MFRIRGYQRGEPVLLRRYFIFGTAAVSIFATRTDAQPVKIEHTVQPIKQPSTWSCWAAAATMIYNWRLGGIQQDIETVVGLAGPKYVQLFKDSFPPKNSGISAIDEEAFYKALPMSVIKGLNPSVDGWAKILNDKGPLSITVDAKPPTGTIHALVVTGLDGDGTTNNTIITYIDPGDGMQRSVPFEYFNTLYQGSANWPLQIIHNP